MTRRRFYIDEDQPEKGIDEVVERFFPGSAILVFDPDDPREAIESAIKQFLPEYELTRKERIYEMELP